jgi:hypothetical protein
MKRIDLHQTAIAILEAINLAEKIKSTRLDNLATAINFGDCWYKNRCIEQLKLSDRVIARLESRYQNHLKKLEK